MIDDLIKTSANKRAPGRAAEIKRWAAEAFALPEDASVMVTELRCSEPGCPPLETVVALLEATGPVRQFKVHKSLAEVTLADVRALAEGASTCGGHDQ